MQMIKSWNVGGGGGGRADASHDSSGERKEIDGIISLYPPFIFPPFFLFLDHLCVVVLYGYNFDHQWKKKTKLLVWPSVFGWGGAPRVAQLYSRAPPALFHDFIPWVTDPLENKNKREGEKYVGEEHLPKINVELLKKKYYRSPEAADYFIILFVVYVRMA